MRFLADVDNAVYYQAPQLWERELIAAGWTKWRNSVSYWVDPAGEIYFGLYRAWKTMRKQ